MGSKKGKLQPETGRTESENEPDAFRKRKGLSWNKNAWAESEYPKGSEYRRHMPRGFGKMGSLKTKRLSAKTRQAPNVRTQPHPEEKKCLVNLVTGLSESPNPKTKRRQSEKRRRQSEKRATTIATGREYKFGESCVSKSPNPKTTKVIQKTKASVGKRASRKRVQKCHKLNENPICKTCPVSGGCTDEAFV